MLRRKKVLPHINKEKISLADQPLPNTKHILFGEDFLFVASKQAELPCSLAKSFISNAQMPKQSFQKSGIIKDRQRPKTTGHFSKYQTNRQKTIGPFTPTRAPQTNTQQLLREDGRKSPQTLKSYMFCQDIKSLSTLFQLQNVQI